jgi:hypothetical protein
MSQRNRSLLDDTGYFAWLILIYTGLGIAVAAATFGVIWTLPS